MSWHFLQGLEEVSSEAICWDGNAFAPSSGQTTLAGYCLLGSATDACQNSQSGMTCKPSTASRGEEGSMSSQGDSHAKTFPPLERGQESKESEAECGSTWRVSLAKYDPASRSWRTRQCSLFGGLEEFSGTWPRWGMMRDGECWAQLTPVRHTPESEYGLWPTPLKSDGHICAYPMRSFLRDHSIASMSEFAGRLYGMRITPETHEVAMQWPDGWTDLLAQEMAKFRKWSASHGKPLEGLENE